MDDAQSDPLVVKAAEFAKTKHQHQKRLDGVTPYFAHCEGVARIVAGKTKDPTLIAAAYLHDTIEDTGVTYDKLERKFGRDVADIVSALSHDNRLPEKAQLEEYRKRLFSAPLGTRVIKVADILQNIQSLGDAVARAKPDFEIRAITRWTETLHLLAKSYSEADQVHPLGMAFMELHKDSADALVQRALEMGFKQEDLEDE